MKLVGEDINDIGRWLAASPHGFVCGTPLASLYHVASELDAFHIVEHKTLHEQNLMAHSATDFAAQWRPMSRFWHHLLSRQTARSLHAGRHPVRRVCYHYVVARLRRSAPTLSASRGKTGML